MAVRRRYIAVIFAFAGLLRPQTQEASRPHTLARKGASAPFWVSTAAAVNEAPTPCPHSIVNSHPTARSHHYTSLEHASSEAGAVYRGTIQHIEQGLLSGMAAALLEVAIVDPIKTSPGFPVSGIVYVAYPVAELKIAGQRVCNAGPNPGFTPHVGDELVVIAHDRPIDDRGRFLPAGEDQLMFEHDRRLIVSPSLQRVLAPELQSLDQVAERLRPAR